MTVQEAGPKPAADEKVFFTPTTAYVGDEWSLDRCDRITPPSLTAADEYWTKTGAYWTAVRRVWANTFAQHDRVTLRRDVDGRNFFEEHFAYAKKLEAGAPCDPTNAERHARETIVRFLITKSPCPGTSLPPPSAPASPTRRATKPVSTSSTSTADLQRLRRPRQIHLGFPAKDREFVLSAAHKFCPNL